NFTQLIKDGIHVIPPASGDLACGEVGAGRLAEVDHMVATLEKFFAPAGPLKDKHILITAGPTYEAIDPVRYIANRSSGKQGYAIARALASKGARVSLVSGPTNLAPPEGVTVINIESALEMLTACQNTLPADVAICVAAVADWRVSTAAPQKIKKQDGTLPSLELTENPDILKTLSAATPNRPSLVIGFAAETENISAHAEAKLNKKGCDWIVANDVSTIDGKSVMGGDHNKVTLITAEGREDWDQAPKDQIAEQLAQKIEDHFTKSG
ncbi:MAG: bifunctional phosphopantothenoylcysteine decarboxylase/phosphopantothenate--cysteine ligase CoaBC, partial [Emcibacter sp.]|nr:bifunctional phosphopantothenoylcysteine decarboxylase/phosphopantothenate--cysteine ligase CoaBC [Emcibacter sp.]